MATPWRCLDRGVGVEPCRPLHWRSHGTGTLQSLLVPARFCVSARDPTRHRRLPFGPPYHTLRTRAGSRGWACRPLSPAPLLRLHPRTDRPVRRSEEHTSELQSLMRISYAVFCLKKKKTITYTNITPVQ